MPSKIKIEGITVEIGGDTTKLGNALKDVNQQSKSLQTELKGVNSLLKLDPSNVTLLKQKQDLLNQSIAECREKLNILKSTQQQVQEQFNKGEITEQQYRDFQREIVATETKLSSLERQAKSFGSVGSQQVATVGTKMQSLGQSIQNTGKKLTVVSAAASAALAGIAKSAIDFETAFTGVTKTVDGTDQELEDIRQGLFDLSEATASSVIDIASVAEAAGQLGVKTENILNFTDTMVRLGDSTNLSADEAATAIAQLYNVMGSDINTVDRFGAAIVALGNNAATTEADILNMATRIGSSGKQVGLTEQEILALATSLSSVGLEAEGGGSAISAVITKIDKDVALNSNTLKTWANVAGMSVTEFKNLWQNDAMSAIQAIVKGMGDASKGGENLNVILDDLGVTSLRQTDAMKRLSSASELMSEMVGISNEAWSENSALTTESSKRYETTAAKLQQVKNTVMELCSKLGEILLPIIQNICNGLSNFVNWLTNLNPAAQIIMLVVIALVAALGPMLIFVGKIISAVGTILTFAPKFVTMFGTIKTALSGLFSFIAANPVILVITSIIAAIVLLWNNCEWFRNLVMSLLSTITNALTSIWQWLQNMFSDVYQQATNVINEIIAVVSTIADWFDTNVIQPIWNMIQNFLNFIATIADWINTNVIQPILNIIMPIIEKIGEIVAKIWEIITTLFGVLANWVYENVISPMIKSIQNFVQSVIKFFQDIWNKIVEIFSIVANWVYENVIKPNLESMQQFVQTTITFFQDIWNKIVEIFSVVSSFFRKCISKCL